MPALPIKIATGVVAAGAIGGGGIYSFYRLNDTTDTVENYLKNNNLRPVAGTTWDFWRKLFKTYKIEKTDETSIKEGEIQNENPIKDWCSETLRKEIKSTKDPLFKKASKWCVEYKTIREALGGESKFETAVATLETKYTGLDEEIKTAVDQIQITQTTNDKGEKIKKWCDENSYRRSTEDNKTHTENIKKICLKAEPAA